MDSEVRDALWQLRIHFAAHADVARADGNGDRLAEAMSGMENVETLRRAIVGN